MVKSNQSRALWPYLIVLGLLFVLSLAAPRSWDRTKPTPAPEIKTTVAAPPVCERPTILQAREERQVPTLIAGTPTDPAVGPRSAPLAEKVTEQYLPPLMPAPQTPGPIVVPPTTPPTVQESAPRDERLAIAERHWDETRVRARRVVARRPRQLRANRRADHGHARRRDAGQAAGHAQA
ncbi:MAG: hypothetical protein QM811_25340 [Pirellulales bacterium]